MSGGHGELCDEEIKLLHKDNLNLNSQSYVSTVLRYMYVYI